LSVAGEAGCAGLIGADFNHTQAAEAGDEQGLDGGTEAGPSPFTVVSGLPTGEIFYAVWAADTRNVFVVGTNGSHQDLYEGSWQRNDGIVGRDYYALWGDSLTDVYAVGVTHADQKGIIQHFDGKAWRDEYVADTELFGVWGAGNVVYAVGAKGQIYGKQKGTTTWAPRLSMGLPANTKVPVTDQSPVLYGISGNNQNDFAMAAGQDRVFHYEGSGNFVNLDPAVDRTIEFRAVWGPASTSTNIFFGTNYLGVTWLSAPRPAPGLDAALKDDNLVRLHTDQSAGAKDLFINGIWGTPARAIFAGDKGHIFTFDIATDKFSAVSSPTQQDLLGVGGTSLSDVWIVGANELILHGAFTQ
jgi:hypothetical protein